MKADTLMSTSRSFPAVVAVTGVAVLALSACTSSSARGPAASSPAPSGFDAAVTSVVNPSSATGGTLRLAASADCDSWDPARTYLTWCWDLQRLMTRTLVGYAPKPGPGGTEIVGDLATGPGKRNADATVWTYTLKPGITFEDGTPITSQDVKYGIERSFDVEQISGGPSQYLIPLLTEMDDKGNPAYQGPYKSGAKDLTSVTTPDPSTIVFTLRKPYPAFDYVMALPVAAPVPKAKDTGGKYGSHPVASGPFKISDYKPGVSMTLVRNDKWNQDSDSIRSPKVSTVSLTVFSNSADADARLEAGTLDLVVDTGVQSAFQTKILTDSTLKANADAPVTGSISYLAVTPSVAPLDNKACREAVFYALNKRSALLAQGGDMAGEIATNMVPLNLPGNDPAYDPYPSGTDGSGDVSTAKAKLAECGQPNGFSTNVAYAATEKGQAQFAAFQEALARVGITVAAKAINPPDYFGYIGSQQTVVDQKLGLMVVNWTPDFPNAQGLWAPIVSSDMISDEGNTNFALLRSPVVDQALASPKSGDPSPAAQAEVNTSINHAVMDSASYLPYVWDRVLRYRAPRLTNVYLNGGLGNNYDLVNIGVSDGK